MEEQPKNNAERLRELHEIFWNKQKEDKDWTVQTKVVEFNKALLKEISREEAMSFELWHMIVGSTPHENDIKAFDLPDGRIERFIREL